MLHFNFKCTYFWSNWLAAYCKIFRDTCLSSSRFSSTNFSFVSFLFCSSLSWQSSVFCASCSPLILSSRNFCSFILSSILDWWRRRWDCSSSSLRLNSVSVIAPDMPSSPWILKSSYFYSVTCLTKYSSLVAAVLWLFSSRLSPVIVCSNASFSCLSACDFEASSFSLLSYYLILVLSWVYYS